LVPDPLLLIEPQGAIAGQEEVILAADEEPPDHVIEGRGILD
jgi:hypothetical protein